jgi:hypothetical protein
MSGPVCHPLPSYLCSSEKQSTDSRGRNPTPPALLTAIRPQHLPHQRLDGCHINNPWHTTLLQRTPSHANAIHHDLALLTPSRPPFDRRGFEIGSTRMIAASPRTKNPSPDHPIALHMSPHYSLPFTACQGSSSGYKAPSVALACSQLPHRHFVAPQQPHQPGRVEKRGEGEEWSQVHRSISSPRRSCQSRERCPE